MYFCGRPAVPTITVEAQNIDRERHSHPQTTKVHEFESRNLKNARKKPDICQKVPVFLSSKTDLNSFGPLVIVSVAFKLTSDDNL